MLLGELQRALEQQNGAVNGPHIDDFLIDKKAHAALSGAQPDAVEQVFVCDEPEQPGLAIYIAPDTLALASRGQPSLSDVAHLDAYCVATEAVSHFVLLNHRAEWDAQVSLLELELQAEVDKFVHLSERLALRTGSPEQDALFDRLFERYSLRAHVSHEESDRYRTASDAAARFCKRIQAQPRSVSQRVRAFFAASLQDKLRALVRA